jgi:hypothetical protein
LAFGACPNGSPRSIWEIPSGPIPAPARPKDVPSSTPQACPKSAKRFPLCGGHRLARPRVLKAPPDVGRFSGRLPQAPNGGVLPTPGQRNIYSPNAPLSDEIHVVVATHVTYLLDVLSHCMSPLPDVYLPNF